RRWAGHKSTVVAVAYSRDGKLLASGSADGTIALWDAATGNERKRFTAADAIKSIAFARDSDHLISAARNGALQTWDPGAGMVRSLRLPSDMTAPVLSPTGEYATSVGGDGAGSFGAFNPDRPMQWFNVRAGKSLKPIHLYLDRSKDEVNRRFEATVLW